MKEATCLISQVTPCKYSPTVPASPSTGVYQANTTLSFFRFQKTLVKRNKILTKHTLFLLLLGFSILSAWEVCTTSFVGYANAADQGCKHTLTDRPGGPTTNVFQPPLKNGDPCPTFFHLFLLHFCVFTKDACEN